MVLKEEYLWLRFQLVRCVMVQTVQTGTNMLRPSARRRLPLQRCCLAAALLPGVLQTRFCKVVMIVSTNRELVQPVLAVMYSLHCVLFAVSAYQYYVTLIQPGHG